MNRLLTERDLSQLRSQELIGADETAFWVGDKLVAENVLTQVRRIITAPGLVLESNRLYLGRTIEYTETKNLVPMLEGRSSIGRLGLFVHVTAGFGDVGFKGFWTLEIFCVQPIKIYPDVEICQVYYHTLEGDYENYSSGKYQNNQGIQSSMLFKDFKTDK